MKKEIAAIDTEAARFLTQVLARFSETYKRSKGFDEPPVHDPCTVAYVIDPTVMQVRKAPVHVEYRGLYTNGMTVADLRKPAPQDCHTAVALKLDHKRFWDMIIAAVKNL